MKKSRNDKHIYALYSPAFYNLIGNKNFIYMPACPACAYQNSLYGTAIGICHNCGYNINREFKELLNFYDIKVEKRVDRLYNEQ